jgi:diguanylate cyclase (GGDEF)-like protein
MGVYVKTLLIAAIIVALTTSALVMSDVADRMTPSWANALIALAGVLIGGFVMLAMRAMRGPVSTSSPGLLTAEPERVVESEPVAPVAPVPQPPPAAPPVEENVRTDEGFMGFVEELMAATTSDGLLAAVKTKLPPLIGGRKVWIVSELQTRHSSDGVEQPAADQDTQLTAAIQQWTTFPLRANNKSVGLLGVESAGGLGTERQQVVERLTPLLARAVSTVGTIETFREAGLVDLLTGAATRREGLNRLNSEVKRAQRTGTSMAVLMVDLDHFKSVNDRYGHAVGDALLTAIGRTLRGTLRASDIRCRWGGEEFLIVLPDTDLARAQVVAGHLLHNIANAYVPMPSGPVTTTASIGLTISRPRESAGTNLVARADLALYRAKREGRSCIRVVLGDHEGKPIGVSSQSPEPSTSRSPALPFPDRRSAERTDRRRVPSSGRRRTDPAPPAEGAVAPSAGSAERRGQVMAASR